MTIAETLLWFVAVPALIVLVVGGLAYAFGGGERRAGRYRPGRPYDFAPVWFLSAPEQVTSASNATAISGKPQTPALPGGDRSGSATAERRGAGLGEEAQTGGTVLPQGALGGASDRW